MSSSQEVASFTFTVSAKTNPPENAASINPVRLARVVPGETMYKSPEGIPTRFFSKTQLKDMIDTLDCSVTVTASNCTVLFTPPPCSVCVDCSSGELCEVIPSSIDENALVCLEDGESVKLVSAVSIDDHIQYLINCTENTVDVKSKSDDLKTAITGAIEGFSSNGSEDRTTQILKAIQDVLGATYNCSSTTRTVVENISSFSKIDSSVGSIAKQLTSPVGVLCGFLSITPTKGTEPRDAVVTSTFSVCACTEEETPDDTATDGGDGAEKKDDASDSSSDITEDEKEDDDDDSNDDDTENADGDDDNNDNGDSKKKTTTTTTTTSKSKGRTAVVDDNEDDEDEDETATDNN